MGERAPRPGQMADGISVDVEILQIGPPRSAGQLKMTIKHLTPKGLQNACSPSRGFCKLVTVPTLANMVGDDKMPVVPPVAASRRPLVPPSALCAVCFDRC